MPDISTFNQSKFLSKKNKFNYFCTIAIIFINVSVFLYMVKKGVPPTNPSRDQIIDWGGAYPFSILDGQWWRLISSMFVHFGCIHLAGNMLLLLFIGLFLEPIVGKFRFFSIYLVSGITATLLALPYNFNAKIVSSGASGAIYGLFGATVVFLMMGVISKNQRSWFMWGGGAYFVFDLFWSLKDEGIDHLAHFSGLLVGFILGAYLSYIMKKNLSTMKSTLLGFILLLCIFCSTIPSIYPLKKSVSKLNSFCEVYDEFTLERKKIPKLLKNIEDQPLNKIIEILENQVIPMLNKECSLANEAKLFIVQPIQQEIADKMHQWSHLFLKKYSLFLEYQKSHSLDILQQFFDTEQEIESLLNSEST